MKKINYLFFVALFLLAANNAFALQCNQSRDIDGSSDNCWSSVTVASNETTLVSAGTVLVYDVNNAKNSASAASYQVRVTTASSSGVFVAGVAQKSIASGETALVLVRGRGDLAVKTTDTLASGTPVWVSSSGDATIATSTTQNQLGFTLEPQAAVATGSRATKKAYITII